MIGVTVNSRRLDPRGQTKHKSFSLTPTLQDAIAECSTRTGRSRSEIVREALDLYFLSLKERN